MVIFIKKISVCTIVLITVYVMYLMLIKIDFRSLRIRDHSNVVIKKK